MGRGKYILIAIAVMANVFMAALVGLMVGGLPGLAGGVIVGVCISLPMLPYSR